MYILLTVKREKSVLNYFEKYASTKVALSSFQEIWHIKRVVSVAFKFHNATVSLADKPLPAPTGTEIS